MALSRRSIPALVMVLALAGCVQPPAPEPAVQRTSSPPWDAPRDAISNIEAAGLPQLGLDDTSDPHIVQLGVTIDGDGVELPAHIGIDRRRAVQAPVHTHDTSGKVWLEGRGNREVTLGQFFQLWGVRFDDRCLGAACDRLEVTVDGRRVASPTKVVLREATRIQVTAHS